MSGLFITIEGGEGAGKSTQSRLLCEYFEQMKKPYLFVREPGATSLGEKIRGILLDKKTGRINHHAEIMLYAAARAQLMEEKIRPALEAGNTVICDRFLDSSVAYQGFGRGIELKAIYDINKYALLGTEPDITFFLDIFPAEAFSRKERDAKDRIESEEMPFHERVYYGYRQLCKDFPERVTLINARMAPEDIHAEMLSILKRRFDI